ncbi:MAG: hypothetical protein B7Z31_10390 [Rhodobacterales bacterium 12-65-15]|nr:MAG: hypothetical protein B7Z31_10390 [Rhodobacterales bacterium 12-65-15]
MTAEDSPYVVRLAGTTEDQIAAQRLRYAVFVDELGGSGPMVDHAARLERDAFDPYFDHLVLVDRRRDPLGLDHVVGVYRVMPLDRRAAAQRFYSETEYDLTPLLASGRRLLELGRSCVDRNHRGGSAMFLPMDLVAPECLDRKAAMAATPALIKAYLRLGGFVGDGAFVDHAFNTTDVCLVMDTGLMSARHREFYLRKSRAA